MKRCLFLLLGLAPLLTQAQSESLKPIEEHLMPAAWGYYRYGGGGVRNVYSYDGLDVRRVTELEPYIRALGNRESIDLYDRFVKQRSGSNALYGAGGALVLIGSIVGLSNPVNKVEERTWVSVGSAFVYSTTGGGTPTYGGYYDTQTVDKNAKGRAAGLVTVLAGGTLMGIGAILRNAANNTFHRSVQHYNRALKRQVSVRYEPFAGPRVAGLSVTARF